MRKLLNKKREMICIYDFSCLLDRQKFRRKKIRLNLLIELRRKNSFSSPNHQARIDACWREGIDKDLFDCRAARLIEPEAVYHLHTSIMFSAREVAAIHYRFACPERRRIIVAPNYKDIRCPAYLHASQQPVLRLSSLSDDRAQSLKG